MHKQHYYYSLKTLYVRKQNLLKRSCLMYLSALSPRLTIGGRTNYLQILLLSRIHLMYETCTKNTKWFNLLFVTQTKRVITSPLRSKYVAIDTQLGASFFLFRHDQSYYYIMYIKMY